MKRLLLLTFLLISCAHTQDIYSHLEWDAVDSTITGQPLVPEQVDYIVFIGDSVMFYEYLTTSDTLVYLLADEALYSDSTAYFYVRAHRVGTQAFSVPSDTVKGFFPYIIPGKVYNVNFLKL